MQIGGANLQASGSRGNARVWQRVTARAGHGASLGAAGEAGPGHERCNDRGRNPGRCGGELDCTSTWIIYCLFHFSWTCMFVE